MKDLEIKTEKYIDLSSIIPEEWETWFYNDFSDNAPFSWGDNDLTLLCAQRVREHLTDVIDYCYSEGDDDIKDDIDKSLPAVLDTLSYLEAEKININLEA